MHIHVRGPNGEAKVWLELVISLMDSKGFSPRELADIIREVIKNRTAIERAWHEHFGN